MQFELKLFDTTLLEFQCDPNAADPHITITHVTDSERKLLPLGLTATNKGLETWISRRVIPKNRAYMQNLLAKCGLSANRPMAIISASKGLSLNDSYWIVPKELNATFSQYNLYDNPISNVLSQIVFTGHGSQVRSSFLSSPEFTTNGMLAKCWRRKSGVISLWKSGTEGAANAGNEPYSEFYAYQVAHALGLNAVPYDLHRWKGRLCSSCELFTSKEVAFVPMSKLIGDGGIAAVEQRCAELGKDYSEALYDMILFDALVCNTDRHLGNFGVLVESRTNTITEPAPLFDHGNALFPFAFGEDLESDEALGRYAATLAPALYDDFFSMAQAHLTPARRSKLRKLLDFRFTKHRSVKNLPDKRLRLIEGQIKQRARRLLD